MLDTTLDIEGMHCAGCAGRVQRLIEAQPGVENAAVNLATASARVSHRGAPARLAKALTEAGYPTRERHDAAAPTARPDEAPALRRAFVIALALTLPVFIAEMGGHLWPGFHHWLHGLIGQATLWRIEAALTLAVLAGPGRIFYQRGLPALLRGAPEMNALVVLGATAAFGYSLVATFAPGLMPPEARHVYFESACVIVTLILLGRWLEARAKGRASAAIRRLVEMTPTTALRQSGAEWHETPASDLAPGDIIRLRPGERVAADGEIIAGHGHINEAMLTGEPLPAAKAPGDAVTGGTVNGTAALDLRVTATGAQTRLARIIRLVEDAQATRLPVQRLVDRVVRVFVPAVMALAALAFVLWMLFAPAPALPQALVAAISVLVIACPCAMGLAVPVSILVGTGRAAEMGILFRRGDALQRLAGAQRVGFDKTGTLTEGAPELVAIRSTDGLSETEALRLAASAEAGSEHPLARALRDAASAQGLSLIPASEVTALPGLGLSAHVDGQPLLLGNAAALQEAGIALDPALPAEPAATPVLVARDGRHIATLSLSDRPRPQSREAVAALSALGLDLAVISGDSSENARHLAEGLGIAEAHGGLSPEAKLTLIREGGAGDIFVGDGINDAPALAGAATGIAMGSGSDVAIEAAETVLMRPDPTLVADAIRLSRAVMANIRQNLFWAFAYNIVLIPVAMGALVPFGGPQLSPMLGALAMALSSVFVVTNALRLRRFR